MTGTDQLAAKFATQLGREVKVGFPSKFGLHGKTCQLSGTLVAVDAEAITLESPTGEDRVSLATLSRGCYVARLETGELDDTLIFV